MRATVPTVGVVNPVPLLPPSTAEAAGVFASDATSSVMSSVNSMQHVLAFVTEPMSGSAAATTNAGTAGSAPSDDAPSETIDLDELPAPPKKARSAGGK